MEMIFFNVHIQSKVLQHTFVVGASSDLSQTFSPRLKKRWVWIEKRASYLATTLALKEHYRPV